MAYDDRVKATDPDAGDTITFAKVLGPDWMTVGENGAVGGTPGVSDVGSDIAVSISAEDTDGAADTLTTSIAVIAKDVVVMADPDIQNEIPIPADRSSISLDFSNNSSLSIAFTERRGCKSDHFGQADLDFKNYGGISNGARVHQCGALY